MRDERILEATAALPLRHRWLLQQVMSTPFGQMMMPVITGLQSQLSQGVGASDDYGESSTALPMLSLPASAASVAPPFSSLPPSASAAPSSPLKKPLVSSSGDKDALLLKLEQTSSKHAV
jgi:hypothetical protein